MDVSKGAAAQPSQSSNPELIAIEIKRLENALRHLERSQVELEEALVDEGEDIEYRTAIDENKVVISNMKSSIHILQEQFKKLTGERFSLSES